MAFPVPDVHGSSQLVLTVDSAKTVPPAPRPCQRRRMQTNRALLIPRGRLFGRAESSVHSVLQYIATAKAPCQAFALAGRKIFRRQNARQFFPATRSMRDLFCGAALRAAAGPSESPPMRTSCRPPPAESAARPKTACAAPAGARARARAPGRSTSPAQSPVDS